MTFWTSVVVQLDSQPGRTGIAPTHKDARNGMLDVLRSARANRNVTIDYFRTGIHRAHHPGGQNQLNEEQSCGVSS
jgi:hypothetical protein